MRRRVLFLASGDPAGAQIAAALLRHLGGDRFAVWSAAADSSDATAPVARVLAEVGIAAPAPAAPLAHYAGQAFDEAITICTGAPT